MPQIEHQIRDILICDDHPICQMGVESYLREFLPGSLRIRKSELGQNTVQLFQQSPPDLLVLDLSLPDISGLEVLRTVKQTPHQARVMIVTSCEDLSALRELKKSGADAILWKSHKQSVFQEALRRLQTSSGTTEAFVDPDIQRAFDKPPTDGLTKREWEVLELIAQGGTNEAIAKTLGCSMETVKTHRANLGQKTQSRNRAELTAWFLQRNGKTNFSAPSKN